MYIVFFPALFCNIDNEYLFNKYFFIFQSPHDHDYVDKNRPAAQPSKKVSCPSTIRMRSCLKFTRYQVSIIPFLKALVGQVQRYIFGDGPHLK